MARAEVRGTFSQLGPRRPASAGRLARTLGPAKFISSAALALRCSCNEMPRFGNALPENLSVIHRRREVALSTASIAPSGLCGLARPSRSGATRNSLVLQHSSSRALWSKALQGRLRCSVACATDPPSNAPRSSSYTSRLHVIVPASSISSSCSALAAVTSGA